MLQSVSPTHDPHHRHSTSTSLSSLTASLHDGNLHLLLAASGSVATIKLPLILSSLARFAPRLRIRVLLTDAASRFLSGQNPPEQPHHSAFREDRARYPNVDAVYVGDEAEWRDPWRRGEGVMHIELRRWADLMVIAPLSANALAKIANGMADGLLTSVVRAWDPWGALDGVGLPAAAGVAAAAAPTAGDEQEGRGGIGGVQGRIAGRRTRKKRILVAPAMNTAMWRHPITAKQLRVLEEEWGVGGGGVAGVGAVSAGEASATTVTTTAGVENPAAAVVDDNRAEAEERSDGWFEVLRPVQKTLVCGDVGDGAMMEWSQIVRVIEQRLGLIEPGGDGAGSS